MDNGLPEFLQPTIEWLSQRTFAEQTRPGLCDQTQILEGASTGFSYITSFPDWSPDGKKIVFNGIPKGSPDGADIYVINADGTGLTRLTTDPAYARLCAPLREGGLGESIRDVRIDCAGKRQV